MITQHARGIDGSNELLESLDLLYGLVNQVLRIVRACTPSSVQRDAGTVGGNLGDLQAAPVDAYKHTFHRRRELPRNASQHRTTIHRCCGSACQLGSALRRCPRLQRSIEVNTINHIGLKDRCHVQQVVHRLLNKRQTRQHGVGGVDRVEIFKDAWQRKDQVCDAELVKAGKGLKVFGIDIKLTCKHIRIKQQAGLYTGLAKVESRQLRVQGQVRIDNTDRVGKREFSVHKGHACRQATR